MKTLTFDLETIANPKVIELLPPVQAKKTLKDPEKIAADIAEKRGKRLEELGLDKTTCLICCISMMDADKSKPWHLLLDPDTLDEKTLLSEFWKIAHGYDRFVSFNGIPFDVPILTFRSMVSSVQPSVTISTQKYRITNHVDLRMILGDWDKYAKGTLDFFCKILGLEGKTEGLDGSFVQDMWDCGAYEEIGDYADQDVLATAKLYKRMAGYYF